MGFFDELKRRNVIRVAGVYTVVGWLLVQVAATVEEAIALPAWFDAVVFSFLVIAFPVALIFAWAFELTPEGLKRTSQVAEAESITARTGSRLDVLLIASFLLFAGAMLLPRFLPDESGGGDRADSSGMGSGSAGAEEALDPGDASIAVLPFTDLSRAGDREYFADGVSEEILNVLAQTRGMKVAGRTSSFAFKGRNEDLREIGRILNVEHILEGSVRSQGDAVRVTAQLIQVSDGFQLWSDTYDRELADIFAVQDDIAQQILVALTQRLMVAEAPRVTATTRTDITAYSLFLEARDRIFSRDAQKMERARELLDRAIAIDPTYAPAYASRAKAYMLLADRPGAHGTLPTNEALAGARDDIDRALELDPQLADAYAVNGLINDVTGRPDFAISSLRRAVELNPNSLDARNWLALALSNSGRFRDVTEQLKSLIEIDPLYVSGAHNTFTYAAEIGDFATVKAVAERFIAISKDNSVRSQFQVRLAILNREYAEAFRLMEQWGDEADVQALSNLRREHIALGVTGPDEGSGELKPVLLPYELFNRGDHEGALAAARRAMEASPDFSAAHTVYVNLLASTRHDEELAAYFAREYDGELENFATRLRPRNEVVPPPYQPLALALRAVGDDDGYREVMRRWRFTIDIFRSGGSVSPDRDVDEAAYWAIMGNAERSLDLLEAALEKRRLLPLQDFAARSYDALREQPRFIALRAKNLKRVNAERAKLGYAPLTEAYYDRFLVVEDSS